MPTTPTERTGNQIFSVGKRLSSNALLSYEQSIGRAEGIVKLTVNLNRNLALIGRAGSDNAIDRFYTLTFGRPPRAANKANPGADNAGFGVFSGLTADGA